MEKREFKNKEAMILEPIQNSVQKGYIESGIQCFLLESKGKMEVDYHFHTFHKCLYIIEGKIEYVIEGREFHLTGGDLIWVPALAAHRLKVNENIPYRRMVIYIAPEYIALISNEAVQQIRLIGNYYSYMMQNIAYHPLHSFGKLDEATQSLIKYMADIQEHSENNEEQEGRKELKKQVATTMTQKNALLRRLSLNILFMQWLEKYFESLLHIDTVKNIPKDNIHSDMSMILEYIHGHLDKKISVDEIAQFVHLSKYHLMRKFKEYKGMSMQQYITRERLIKSRELMKEGLALTEISYQVGFPDYTSYARAFKKVYSCSPKKMAKLNPTSWYE